MINADAPTIPHSREAEESLIGAVLINPAAYHEVARLQADDFYIHRHRFIWEAITRLHERRSPVDFLTVAEELDRAGQLAEVGGPAYVTALINATPTSMHAEAYARIVEEMAVRRRMLEAANQVAKLAYQRDQSLAAVLDASDAAIADAGARMATQSLIPLSQIIAGLYEEITEQASNPLPPGLPTGFVELDRLLSGLQPSDFVVIAGRPSQGKTSFLLNVIGHIGWTLRKRVAFFSLEMSAQQVGYRLYQQQTGIDSRLLRAARLADHEWALLAEATETLAKAVIFVDETPAITPAQMRAKCRRLQALEGLDLVVLDYLQLMTGGGRFGNRQEEVSYLSRSAKHLAKELHVPVVVAAQLSRSVEQRPDKMPILSDLRESGSIEMDADTVIFLHRPVPNQFATSVTVAKQRNGPTGAVNLVFNPTASRFEENAVQSASSSKNEAA